MASENQLGLQEVLGPGETQQDYDSVVRVGCNCKGLGCKCVIDCDPINPVVNPIPVLYSRRTRDNTIIRIKMDPRERNVIEGTSYIMTNLTHKSTIFWDITLSSPLSVNRRFGGTSHLHLQGRKNKLNKILSLKAGDKQKFIFSTLKMEAICFSETSVYSHRTTQRYTLHNHRCENPKSCLTHEI
jgi:hypothetical protein